MKRISTSLIVAVLLVSVVGIASNFDFWSEIMIANMIEASDIITELSANPYGLWSETTSKMAVIVQSYQTAFKNAAMSCDSEMDAKKMVAYAYAFMGLKLFAQGLEDVDTCLMTSGTFLIQAGTEYLNQQK